MNLHPGRRALLVEDNESTRRAAAQFLAAAGFAVDEAGTAADALRLASVGPDLVILDVGLPDSDGFELCRRLKAEPGSESTPILMVSGVFVDSGDRVRGLDVGADGFLAKPYQPEELVAYARALLRLRRSEQALRRSEDRFRRLFESDAVPMGCWDANGAVTEANDALLRLVGYTRDDLLAGRVRWRDITPPEYAPLDDRALEEIGTSGACTPFEKEYLRKDGARVPVLVGASAFQGAAQEGVFLAVDLSARHRLEEQLRQASKMEAVGRLAGGVAHDFNNLLTVIGGFAELLLATTPSGHPSREPITQIRRAAERAAALTQQLLTFGRKEVVQRRVLDPDAAVREAEPLLRRLLGEDVDLTVTLRAGDARVAGDPGRLGQVVMNLAVNGRDAMPHGGKLTIETARVRLDEGYAQTHAGVRPGPYVLLAVSDTGEGIAEEVRPHIFEPFFTTKGPGQGTGLGLATVYAIVQQSGGHVQVYSEVGRGTTFKVYLPEADGTTAPTRPAPSTFEQPPRGSETVLLVEDEEPVRSLARRVLEGCGYRVLEASNGAEGLRAAAGHAGAIDLLVTDVVMPTLGGRELAERLKVARPSVRVLFLSGYTDDAVVRHGILHAEVPFLQKPFTPLVLARKVREVLDATPGGPALA